MTMNAGPSSKVKLVSEPVRRAVLGTIPSYPNVMTKPADGPFRQNSARAGIHEFSGVGLNAVLNAFCALPDKSELNIRRGDAIVFIAFCVLWSDRAGAGDAAYWAELSDP